MKTDNYYLVKVNVVTRLNITGHSGKSFLDLTTHYEYSTDFVKFAIAHYQGGYDPVYVDLFTKENYKCKASSNDKPGTFVIDAGCIKPLNYCFNFKKNTSKKKLKKLIDSVNVEFMRKEKNKFIEEQDQKVLKK